MINCLKTSFLLFFRSKNSIFQLFIMSIYFIFFIYIGIYVEFELYFLIGLLSFSFLVDSIKMKTDSRFDLNYIIVSPNSIIHKYLFFFFKIILSEKTILMFTFLIIGYFYHNISIINMFILLFIHFEYCLLRINIDLLSRRIAFVSIFFKNIAPFVFLLVLPFIMHLINPNKMLFIDTICKYYKDASFLFFITLLILLPVSIYLSLKLFRHIYIKYPFPNQFVIENYNKNYWY